MRKMLLLMMALTMISGCTSRSQHEGTQQEKLDYHRNLADHNIEFVKKHNYKLYIIPKTLILSEDKLNDQGKAILSSIKHYHDINKFDNVIVVAHSSVLNKFPIDDAKNTGTLVSNFLSVLYKKNIPFSNKGAEIPYYKRISYNLQKRNERVEILYFNK